MCSKDLGLSGPKSGAHCFSYIALSLCLVTLDVTPHSLGELLAKSWQVTVLPPSWRTPSEFLELMPQ